jgi:hypothetical protein
MLRLFSTTLSYWGNCYCINRSQKCYYNLCVLQHQHIDWNKWRKEGTSVLLKSSYGFDLDLTVTFLQNSSQESRSNRIVSGILKCGSYLEQSVYSNREYPLSCLPPCCQTLEYLQPKFQHWRLVDGNIRCNVLRLPVPNMWRIGFLW